jgi:hypothetical protein
MRPQLNWRRSYPAERSRDSRPEIATMTSRGHPEMRLFALGATAEFGKAVARALHLPLAAHEERDLWNR